MQPYYYSSTQAVRIPPPDRPLLVNNVARITGLSISAVRWNAQKGLLIGRKDPARPKIWIFNRADVDAFMLGRRHVVQAN